MKILLLNTSERTGGAAIAANRLMKALINNGIEAKSLILKKQTDNENVVSVQTAVIKKYYSKFAFLWERLVIFFCNHFNRKYLFKVSIANAGFDISGHPLVKSADIIHIHWINQGFLSLSDIKKLTRLGKPIVWTMHDMWLCTGICHHARECINYRNECGRCFYLSSSNPKDISHRIFSAKKKILQHKNCTYIGCSRWMAEKAKLSSLTREERVLSIPNPIDIDVFRKKNKELAREYLNLPPSKYLLLFGAVNVTDDRKGLNYLIKGLNYLKQQFPTLYQKMELVIFGQIKSEIRPFFDIPIHPMNLLKDEETIVNLYNTVDLFITPSLDENLPNTIMEAMACGTPCIGFHTGGIPEMIDHKENGYVAKYQDVEDLMNGVVWILNHPDSEKLSESCRKKVLENYAESVVAKEYITLYANLLRKETQPVFL
jgi:glycosyltransferase involved in cell wall biosynthesis